jgi:hypothetical protein
VQLSVVCGRILASLERGTRKTNSSATWQPAHGMRLHTGQIFLSNRACIRVSIKYYHLPLSTLQNGEASDQASLEPRGYKFIGCASHFRVIHYLLPTESVAQNGSLDIQSMPIREGVGMYHGITLPSQTQGCGPHLTDNDQDGCRYQKHETRELRSAALIIQSSPMQQVVG